MSRSNNNWPDGWPEIRIWPDPKPGIPYGPNPIQKPIFIDYIPPEIRPHLHGLDVVLLIGGAGSSKTTGSIARVSEQAILHPGTKAIVGGRNFPLLRRNVVDAYKKIFSLPGGEWDHPIVKRRPLQNDLTLRIQLPGQEESKISFLNLDKFEVMRGFDADIVQIEEINLLSSASSFDEMVRRSRGRALKVRQFLLTCNPEESFGWLYDKFQLGQYAPGYNGLPIPIGQKCTCQYCQDCLNINHKEVFWVGGRCPECGAIKDTDCPGNQYFYRVLFSKSYDNKHNPSDYVQNMKSILDPESFQRFVEGKIVESKKGKCYISYNKSDHILEHNIGLDLSKDIIWTHDFNYEPMCSVVLQEQPWGVLAVDELVRWNATITDVVNEFEKRYPAHHLKGTIHLYGDPSGLWGKGNTGQATFFQELVNELTRRNYRFLLHMRKIPGNTRISRIDRINSVNAVLMNAEKQIRLKFNPKCEHTIRSIEQVQWAKNGKTPQEDDSCDKASKANPNKNIVHLMTHPAEALGYYIFKSFPILIEKRTDYYAIAPGEFKAEIEEGVVKETISPTKLIQPASVFDRTAPKYVFGQLGVSISNNLTERLRWEEEQKAKFEQERAFLE